MESIVTALAQFGAMGLLCGIILWLHYDSINAFRLERKEDREQIKMMIISFQNEMTLQRQEAMKNREKFTEMLDRQRLDCQKEHEQVAGQTMQCHNMQMSAIRDNQEVLSLIRETLRSK